MVDLDEFTVTDAALEQMAGTANPRLKQIMDAAVRHCYRQCFVRGRSNPGKEICQ